MGSFFKIFDVCLSPRVKKGEKETEMRLPESR